MSKLHKIIMLVTSLILVLIIIVSVSKNIFSYKIVDYNYLEASINPSSSILSKDVINTQNILQKYYVSNNGLHYFTDFNLSLTDNRYSIYYLYYDYLLLKTLGQDTKQIADQLDRIVESVTIASVNREVDIYDIVGCICLEKEINNQTDLTLLDSLDNNFKDKETGLLFETFSDNETGDLSLTIDVLSLLSKSGIEWVTTFENILLNHYEKTVFESPNNNNDIYSAGGEIICAISNLFEIPSTDSVKLQKWLDLWSKKYNPMEVDSWDAVVEYECVYKPVADSLGAPVDTEAIDSFIKNETIRDFLDNNFEERLFFDVLQDHLGHITKKSKKYIIAKYLEAVDKHLSDLLELSMETSYYGCQLAYSLEKKDINYSEVYKSANNYMKNLTDVFVESPEGLDYNRVINDLYYFLLFDYFYNEGTVSPDTKSAIDKLSKKLLSRIKEISSPKELRQLCAIVCKSGTRMSKKIYKTFKAQLIDFMENESIFNSYYCVDIVLTDKMLSMNLIDFNKVKNTIDGLKKNGVYKMTPSPVEKTSLEATFNVAALLSMANQSIEFPQQKMVNKSFKNSAGLFTPFKNNGMPNLQSQYWGICLSYGCPEGENA